MANIIKYTGGSVIYATVSNLYCDNAAAYWYTGSLPPPGASYVINGILDDNNSSTSTDFAYNTNISKTKINTFKTAANIFDTTNGRYPSYVMSYIRLLPKYDNATWGKLTSSTNYVEVRQKTNEITLSAGTTKLWRNRTSANSTTVSVSISPQNAYDKNYFVGANSGLTTSIAQSTKTTASSFTVTGVTKGTWSLSAGTNDSGCNLYSSLTFTVKDAAESITVSYTSPAENGDTISVSATVSPTTADCGNSFTLCKTSGQGTVSGTSITVGDGTGVFRATTTDGYASTSFLVACKVHTVTFYNGSTSISSNTGPKGTAISAPTNPTKTGYTFKGWATTNGGTTAVTPVTTIGTTDVNYYAIWQINTYSITINVENGKAQYGTGSASSTVYASVNYGSSLTVTVTSNTGYHIASTSGGTLANTGSAVTSTTFNTGTITEKATFKITCDINQYTVSFSILNGYLITNNQHLSTGNTTADYNTTLQRTIYANTGAYINSCTNGTLSKTGTGTSSAIFTTKTVTSSFTATVTCNKYTYTIYWNPNGGTISGGTAGTSVATTVEYGGTVTAPGVDAPATTAYHTYSGFSKWSGSNGASVSARGSYSNVTSNITFTAQWKTTDRQYILTMYARGGKYSNSATYKQYSTTYAGTVYWDTGDLPSYTYYVLGGWASTSTATTATISASTSSYAPMVSSKQLYAIWTIAPKCTYLLTQQAGIVSSSGTSTAGANVFKYIGTFLYNGKIYYRFTQYGYITKDTYTLSTAFGGGMWDYIFTVAQITEMNTSSASIILNSKKSSTPYYYWTPFAKLAYNGPTFYSDGVEEKVIAAGNYV